MTRKDPNGTGDDVQPHVRLAGGACDTASRLEAALFEADAPWGDRYREARAILKDASRLVEESEAACPGREAAGITLTPAERESARRVLTFLEAEADGSDERFRALWRRLAANVRRELLVD